MSSSLFELKSTRTTKDLIIVSFGGVALKMQGIPPFEFLNHLSKNFDYDMLFFVDPKTKWYHLGIDGISNDIPSTAEYIGKRISGYKKVIFLGISAGGYAAILFGSLLNVNHVIAYTPQTLHLDLTDVRYRDIKPYINDTTDYILYYDSKIPDSDTLHNTEQCLRFQDIPNVTLIDEPTLDMKRLRDNGDIKRLLTKLIESS